MTGAKTFLWCRGCWQYSAGWSGNELR